MVRHASTRTKPRSLGVVLLGFVLLVLLSVLTDALFHRTGVFPPLGEPMQDPLWLLALCYRILYGIVGCYVTARFAPGRPMEHAVALGILGTVLTIVGISVNWNRGPAFGPHWFALVLVAISLPCAWIGAKLWIGSSLRSVVTRNR